MITRITYHEVMMKHTEVRKNPRKCWRFGEDEGEEESESEKRELKCGWRKTLEEEGG